jgi:DNA topoisomerase-6 subunit B
MLPESTPLAPERRASAETMASRQREISVSEFFTKNRHLLGFDNPAKALLTTVKEAVDNALDASEEAGILPEIIVIIDEVAEGRYRVAVEDGGPGIVKAQIPKIFAKLLYGSKFHRLKQSRGQQGIGISAAGLYAQLTTGKPVTIISKIGKGRPAWKIELRIDTRKNQPEIVTEGTADWERDHGTRVELELVGAWRGGRTGVEAYLEQTVVANPHLALTFKGPKGEPKVYPRVSNELPREAQEIKPHPHGVELGFLQIMFADSPGKTIAQVLEDDFSRISANVAKEICDKAKVPTKTKAADVRHDALERLHKALGEVKVLAPSATCVVPVGEGLLVEGLKRRFKAEFYTSTTRPPAVYRGNPFVVEAAIAWGGDLPTDESADVMRLANRVPLQYQPKSCAISEAVYDVNWKAYDITQPKGGLPVGPIAIVVHLASVWVPFTSEAKEAVAHYDDLLKELRLALQECGRKLAMYLRAQAKANSAQKRLGIFHRYMPETAQAIALILGSNRDEVLKRFVAALAKQSPVVEADEDAPGNTPSLPPPADAFVAGGSSTREGSPSLRPPQLPQAPKAPKAPETSTKGTKKRKGTSEVGA